MEQSHHSTSLLPPTEQGDENGRKYFRHNATRFRVLLNPIYLSPEKAQLVVQATVVLHNYLMRKAASSYAPPSTFDLENEDGKTISCLWRAHYDPSGTFNQIYEQEGTINIESVKEMRREFTEYFVTLDGEVSRQYELV